MKLIFLILTLSGTVFGFFDFGFDKIISDYHGTGSVSQRFLNGKRITIKNAPYMAVIEADKSFMYSYPFATAVIITDQFLLSTADFFFLQRGKKMRAYLGVQNISLAKPENTYEVETVKIHKLYNLNFLNDIAVIKLKKKIVFNNLHRPIALLSKVNHKLDKFTVFKMLGYGYNKESDKENSLGTLAQIIKRVDARKIDLSKHFFQISINPRLCPGDHGDPLIMNNTLVGLAIFTYGCQKDADPKVTFMGIPHFYRWISKRVGKKNLLEAKKHAYPKLY